MVDETIRSIKEAEQQAEEILVKAQGQKEQSWNSETEAHMVLNKLGIEDHEEEIAHLSGGQKKRVALAAVLVNPADVLILDEPTRGVDVGAKSDIHSLMCEFAAKGMAVIMISSELPEVMGMSDRILVYHEGTINGIVDRSEILANNITQKEMLEMAFAQNR